MENIEIKLSNGVAFIRPFVTRKLQKEIRAALYGGVNGNIEQEDGGKAKQKFSEFDITNLDRANDVAMVGMVEKLIIDDKEMPVNTETFDNMNNDDVQLIINQIEEMTKKK